MVKKLSGRIYLWVILSIGLSGCSAIRGVGNALANSFRGFHISFPTIHMP